MCFKITRSLCRNRMCECHDRDDSRGAVKRGISRLPYEYWISRIFANCFILLEGELPDENNDTAVICYAWMIAVFINSKNGNTIQAIEDYD